MQDTGNSCDSDISLIRYCEDHIYLPLLSNQHVLLKYPHTHEFKSLANYQILFKLFPPSSQKKSTIYESQLKLEARAIASVRTSFSSNGAIHVGHHERFKKESCAVATQK